MNRFWRRRAMMGGLTVAFGLASGALVWREDARLGHGSFLSGYLLLAGVLFLAAFGARKKLSFLPLGAAATWMQWHVYGGFAAVALFILHAGPSPPEGALETVLYVVFVAVSGSGLYGLYLTRTIPRRLTKLREEILYERIPALRHQVAEQAQALVVSLLQRQPAEPIADYYALRLIPYFVGRRPFPYYVRPTSKLRNRLQTEVSDLTRFLSVEERRVQRDLQRLIDRRDDLDYHAALQGKLKMWLFLHIGLTWGLLGASFLHVVLVHAFRGF